MKDNYWKLIDDLSVGPYPSDITTYEHRLPHGMLVMVRTTNGETKTVAISVVFVPNSLP